MRVDGGPGRPQEGNVVRLIRIIGLQAVVATLVLGGAAAGGTLENLEKSVLLHPTSDQPVWDLATAYRESKQAPRAVEFFTRFHQANQPNSQSLIWQGSFKCRAASDEPNMEARLNLLQSGMADMDRAVRLFPDDTRVRALRGITLSRFPAFLQMHGKAIADLEGALSKPAAISPGLQTTVREGLAEAYRQAGRTADAEAVLKPGIR
jgi:lipopolysaccharide biosynthesis regulator YciM